MSTQTSDPSRADYLIGAAADMTHDVRLVRDVAKGTTRLRGQSTRYLPKHASEEPEDYDRRLAMAVLAVNAVERTVTGLAGMVFRKDPTLGDDVPDVIAQHLENVDYAGAHLDTFARDLFEDGLESGHAGILVDAPSVQSADGRRLFAAEEQALGVRPYWIPIRKEQIIGWRTVNEGGKTVLAQLVIHEPTTVDDGAFGEKAIDRYRVYKREAGQVTVEVWEAKEKGEAPELDTGPDVVTNQTEIPFSVFYARRTGFLESRPPLLDVAYTNIAHYQTLADHRYCLHISNVLTPVISGVDADAEITFGPNSGIKIPAPEGRAYYLEPAGNAFEANIKQLQEFKADMATGGLSMLQRERKAAETATANRQDSNVERSQLAAAARSLQDCLESALQFHANFLRLESGGSIAINREFEDQTLTSDEVERFSQLVLRDQWSLDTLWAKLQEGGVNPADFDADTERDRLESEAADSLEAMSAALSDAPARVQEKGPRQMRLIRNEDGSVQGAEVSS